MIQRESLQRKLATAATAGMLLLLLAASCVAQTPLKMSGLENCTNYSANASSLPDLRGADSSSASAPQNFGKTVLISPSGIQNTGKLTYKWVDDSGCMFYCLEVRDHRNKIVLKKWYEASEVLLGTGECSATPPEILEAGDNTWSILCSNCGDDTLSQPMEFTVCKSTSFPGKATLISPKDTIGSLNPTFVWLPVTGCTQYRLKVAKANQQNVPIFESDYLDAEDVFSDTDKTCSFTPEPAELDIEPGTYYRWWIQTINCKGDGPWSNYKSFRYLARPPGRSTPISPRGLIATNTPVFIWTAASAATEYHIQVQNDEDIIVAEDDFRADQVTKGSRCSGSLGTLSDDDPVYYWRVQANNDAYPYDINGTWSGGKYFEMICAYKPGTDKNKARRR